MLISKYKLIRNIKMKTFENPSIDSLYSYDDEQHIVSLVDPFNGEAISSHEIPSSIAEIPKLQKGLNYLRQHANEIQMTMFCSRHSDEVVHAIDELTPLLDRHDVYFLEGYGTVSERRDIYQRAATEELSADDYRNYRSQPSPYTDRQLNAIKGRNKPILMPEIPKDGTDFETALLDYSLLMNELWPLAFGEDGQMTINLLIAQAASNTLREWYMLANMGAQMAEHEEVTGTPLVSPLIWMGGGHEASLSEKMNTLGLPLNIVHSRYNVEHGLSNGGSPFTQAVGKLATEGSLHL